jgi:peptide/nickel transport system substrate-binding protein
VKKFFLPLVIILILSLLVIGCKSSPATTSASTSAKTTTSTSLASNAATATTSATTLTPQYGGILKAMDTRGPSNTLGWYADPQVQYLLPMYSCVEALVKVTFENKVIPWLAESYSVADDLKSVTFVIRKNVKFHDGSDLTGAVVKWNLDQLIAAKVNASTNWSGIDLIDDNTVRINIKVWRNSVFNDLGGVGLMVSKAAFDSVGAEGLRWNPVGTGPFKFVSFKRDVSLIFTKNPNYWQKGKPYLDGIEFYFSSDPMTEAAAVQNGEVDCLGDNVGQTMANLLQSQKGSYLAYNPSGIAAMTSDSANTDSPWSKLNVRQALDHAIDRDAIVKVRGFGYAKTDYQFCYPGTPSYINNLAARTYDPVKARQLLAEAGYPNGFDTNMWADSSSTDKDSFISIQNYLQAVGIRAQFNQIDSATSQNFRSNGWKNGLQCGILGLDANMNNSMGRYFIKSTPFYPCIVKTDDFDAMYTASLAEKTYNPASVQKMVQYLHDNALSCCLWTINHAELCQPYVHDGGWMTWSAWPGWSPDNVWLSKK